jgi:hypothetical protein
MAMRNFSPPERHALAKSVFDRSAYALARWRRFLRTPSVRGAKIPKLAFIG